MHEDHAHPKSRSLHCECTTGYEHVAGHLNAADLSNLVVPQSVPVQRNDEFAVKVNHSDCERRFTRAHQSALIFCHSPFFHSTPINSCCMSMDSIAGHQSNDMSRGSLPPHCSSVNIEMFTPPTGVVTPSSVNQFVLSNAGHPHDHADRCSPCDIQAVQGTGRRDLPSDHVKHRC